MSLQATRNLGTTKYKKTHTISSQVNSVAYLLIGLCFGTFLILSAVNDYLFFEWLAMGTFMVFTLIGMHFIGQKQIKRN